MTEEQEKLLNILWVVLIGAPMVFVLVRYFDAGVIEAISIVVLALTGLAVVVQALATRKQAEATKKQTEATEKMVEHQLIPSIEMFLIHHRDGGHCFAFYNLSSIPGRITFNLSFQQDNTTPELNYKNRDISYRIPPQGVLITTTTFFEKDNNLPEGIEIKKDLVVKIKALIVPDLDNVRADAKRTYRKAYKFTDDHHDSLNNKRWNEETIGFPDILLFCPENAGLKKSVKFVVGEYMEKT